MKTLSKTLLFLTITVLLLSFSLPVFAQETGYQFLAPLPNGAGSSDLSTYVPGIINLSIGIAAVMAFVMITFGGIQYATTDAISGKQDGRKHIWDAIWGLLLVLGAYAILNTINPNILKFDFNLGTPKISTGAPVVVGADGSSGSGCCTYKDGILQGYVLTEQQIEEDTEIRTDLALNKPSISVNKGPCPTGRTDCTNVVGLPDSALNGVKNLSKACGCSLMITGGTEGGHSDHGPGLAVMDLSPSSALNNYLAKTKPEAANPVKGTQVKVGGATYTYEIPGQNGRATGYHWHVQY